MPADAGIRILVGIALLILGRKLFWLFVAAAGFIAGFNIATRFFSGLNEWTALAIAVVAALIGAVLAIFVQKIAIAIAGFLMGGFFTFELLRGLAAVPEPWSWVAYLVGGVIAAILVVALFDWALIILSSVAGALLITQGLTISPSMSPLLTLGLVIVGIIIQAALMRGSRQAS
jgi:hypothetical protein